jgi:chaperonin GroEL
LVLTGVEDMAARHLSFDAAAREQVLRGAEIVGDLAELTLGPRARNVLVGRAFAPPVITDCGYVVALAVDLADATEQIGVQALRDLAWRTSDEVGDGTATAISIGRSILRGCVEAGEAGLEPLALQQAIDDGLERVIAAIAEESRPAIDPAVLLHVAAAAAAGDQPMAEALARAAHEVGPEGVVTVEDGQGLEDDLEVQTGMHLDQGWLASAFVTDSKAQVAEYDDPFFLIAATRITELASLVPALDAFASSGKPLVIIAEDVAGEALATLIRNSGREGVRIVAVRAPGAGQWRGLMLGDIAAATGATVIGDEQGYRLHQFRPGMVGRARKVRIGRTFTTITGGTAKPEQLEQRRQEARHSAEQQRYLSYDRDQHQRRLARLTSGIATVRFGGATPTVLATRKQRATAVAGSTMAALRGGVIRGGGAALLHASAVLDGLNGSRLATRAAGRILRRSLEAPVRALARNRGRDENSTVAVLHERGDPRQGYDVVTDRITDLDATGVLDSTQVVCTALRNGVSTASRLGAIAAAVATA